MHSAVVLFTRDLRVHDHPALAAAARAERVVPLFVLDDAILASHLAAPNRLRFLLAALRDLDGALRDRGAGLVLRRGDPVEETVRVAREVDAVAVFCSADVSAYALDRQRRLREALSEERRDLALHPGVTVVPPAAVKPSGGGDNYEVFTPYLRAWFHAPLRPVAPPPERLVVPSMLRRNPVPALSALTDGTPSRSLPTGGETAGRQRLQAFLDAGAGDYEHAADHLDGDTSMLSAYLHLGCLSPREVVDRADRRRRGIDAFVRQLAWRDFHHQVLAAHPSHAWSDHRPRGDRWVDDDSGLEAWRAGRTGYPVVDAAMRQLRATGWMHGRARMLTAAFLVKDLYVDWRHGARHFLELLVDGDIANNNLNWQWVAGTGTDTRPNRTFNPVRQAARHDPHGDYVRRWVPELAAIAGKAVHTPWELDDPPDGYPPPIVDHAAARQRFLAARGRG